MLKRLTIISLATLLGSTIQLNPAELYRSPQVHEVATPEIIVTKKSPVSEQTVEPTAPPIPKPVASKNPKPVSSEPVPTPTPA